MKNLIPHFLLFIALLSLAIFAFYLFGKKIWHPYYERCFIGQEVQSIPYEEKNTTLSTPIIEKVYIEKNCTQEPCPKCPTCPEPEKLTSQQELFRHLADGGFIRYPKKLTLIGLKHEKRLEIWGTDRSEQHLLATYPFTAFSGILSPKLKEGDRQIPEGIYRIDYLNPNSKFHLSMHLTYPNAFDKKMAKREKRTHLGGEIMIHGSNRTIGCIPIGDDKIEELYALVKKVGLKNVKVILSPVDFRVMTVKIKSNKHPWFEELYKKITKEMKPFISK